MALGLGLVSVIELPGSGMVGSVSSSVFSLSAGSPWPMGFRLLGSPWILTGDKKLDQTKDQPAMNYLDISFLVLFYSKEICEKLSYEEKEQFITKTTAYYVNNEESDGDFGSQFSQLNDLEVSNSIQLRDIGDEL
ncbi:hypothetical protein RhiirA4_484454 [Rhizophagus irregularis]|uniref:Uncharacterized protein n=1 Tax=Rhizophagus irregularis TaxID=588596 RepID=A0A2I1HNX0_9GLOM|nr:hypothetical protein RhiirA4_484454 [Rhizophagus irregularis]